MSRRFSVIIPTHNRPQLLHKVLQHVRALDYPSSDFEVIVVDNAPDDTQTQTVVKTFQRSLPNLKYLLEKKQGPSPARNAGVKVAKYSYLVFVDDDVLVPKTFLQGYELAWKKYPEARILSGKILPQLSNGKKFGLIQWQLMYDHFWCYAYFDLGRADKKLAFGDAFFSANMSYKLPFGSAKIKQEIFDSNLGVQFFQNTQLLAEDYELALRTLLLNEKMIYLANQKMAVQHLVSEVRFTQSYLLDRYFLAGIEMSILEQRLASKFPQFKPFYLESYKNWHGIKKLISNKFDRTMFISYLVNRTYFKSAAMSKK